MWHRFAPASLRDFASGLRPEQVELKGFNRSLAEIEWLLLVLIVAYVVMPTVEVALLPILSACLGFALFVLGFRYFNLFTLEARWKLSIETWVMIALTAYVVWHTGRADSPLVNLYLLPIAGGTPRRLARNTHGSRPVVQSATFAFM
jgi:hypothetical protein